MIPERHITIAGGGLVGALAAIYFSDLGFKVDVFEKRPDPLITKPEEGRSINLALSHRGIKALEAAGLSDEVLQHTIPMKGRMIHERDGKTYFIPYGLEGQHIYSVSRAELNRLLIKKAADSGNVAFYFNTGILDVDPEQSLISVSEGDVVSSRHFEMLFATDGANSAVRESLAGQDKLKYSRDFLSYGYKELHIFPKEGRHKMEPNALHIWPREKFMLIALPNLDGSFTCTLFLPLHGETSFDELQTGQQARKFFTLYFPDALELIEDLEMQFDENPLSSLAMIHTNPWVVGDNILLLGDAAHAIVPFYGQGMNAGFEDCRILREMLLQGDNWNQVLRNFFVGRKPDADAIRELALDNFIEMRDKVADPEFLLRKKMERLLHERFPDKFIPQYSMVTFTDMPYSRAQKGGGENQKLLDSLLTLPGVRDGNFSPEVWKRIEEDLNSWSAGDKIGE